MTTNFNNPPYFDDYSEDDKYLRVLFRPGFPVQARELTQTQSILQNQVSRVGDHLFKNGSKVTDGNIGYEPKFDYVKLQEYYNSIEVSSFIENMVGQTVLGMESGISAKVIFVTVAENGDPPTLFIQYLSKGKEGGESADDTVDRTVAVFADDEELVTQDENNTYAVNTIATSIGETKSSTGTGSIATIKAGVFYVNGFFVKVDEQRIVLDKYSSTPSYRIGLLVSDAFIIPENEPNLYDNALGSTNYSAPGAHRYRIELTLTKRDVEFASTDKDFIELVRVNNGKVDYLVKDTQYADIMDTMARRTYDELGNFIVAPFGINIKEHRNNDRGDWQPTTEYMIGDVVRVANTDAPEGYYYYTARTDGISTSIQTAHPSHIPGDVGYEPVSNVSNGVAWEYTPSFANDGFERRQYNNGKYTPEEGGLADSIAIGIEGGNDKGKAYVYGYEIHKWDTSWLTVPKARTYNNVTDGTVSTQVGNYIKVTNLHNIPSLSTYDIVDLYNKKTVVAGSAAGIKIGTARIRGVELENGANGSATAIYKMSLFDIKMNDGSITKITITSAGAGYSSPTVQFGTPPSGGVQATGTPVVENGNVVAIIITNPGSGYLTAPSVSIVGSNTTPASALTTIGKQDFSRNVKQLYYSGISFTADVSDTLTTVAGTIKYTSGSRKVTGNGTAFKNLKVGETIITSGGVEMQVGFISTDTTLYTVNTVTSTETTGEFFSTTSSQILDPSNLSLIYPMPYQSIRSVRAEDDSTIDTIVKVRKQFSTKVFNVGDSYITFKTTVGGESFSTPDSGAISTDRNYLFYVTSGNGTVTQGQIIYPYRSGIVTPIDVNAFGNEVNCYFPDSYHGASIALIATVTQGGLSARERSKSINRNESLTIETEALAVASNISLGKADVYRIVRITQCAGVEFPDAYDSTKPEIDLTDNYTLDNGQRDTHYDIGSINLKPGVAPPTGPIRIIFEWFQHTGDGSYFSVNSYAGVAYKDIPLYKGTRLSDVIDYRPTINDDGLTYTSAGPLPKRTEDMIASYSYYLARRSLIFVKKTGEIEVTEGVPSNTPTFPSAKSDSMDLFKVTYKPYTIDVDNKSISTEMIENRRYKMSDIDAMSKQITQLINYTNMSALEKATSSMQIPDPILGTDRLKVGYITDPFDSHSVGDINSADYAVSIDTINKEMRPRYNIENINLVEKNTSNIQRSASGYVNNKDVITLKYDHVEMIKQPYASRTENINPFSIFTFIGQVELNPESDEWVDISNVDVTNIDTSERDALESIANASINPVTGKPGLLGQYYGAWEQVVTGTTTVKTNYRTQYDASGQWWLRNGNGTGGLRRQIHDEVTANVVQQQRPAFVTELKLIGNSTPVLTSDKVVATNIVPYIRSRPLLFVGTGLKPKTTLNTYFDGIQVNAYVKPATQVAINAVLSFATKAFNSEIAVGASIKEEARLSSVDGNTALAFNKGDVVYVSSRGGVTYTLANSPATAVVAMVGSVLNESNKPVLHLVNVKKGTFQQGDAIVSTISGGAALVWSNQVTPTSLTTNFAGEVAGVFTIPNTVQRRFRCGSRMFRLSDGPTNAASTTRAEKTYLASGVKEVHNRTFSSIAHYELATRELGKDIGNTTLVTVPGTSRTVADTQWYDPLAQTFLVQNEGGVMLTKLDVFFQSKDPTLPVRLEIRECDNGYPSKTILPFSKVTLAPKDVNISDNGLTPTTFTFPTPVALRDKTEYAIVLLSDSDSYKVWISQMGELDIGTQRMITQQPYAGVLFKSQNGSTWTAEQMQDLKFTLYRAKYDTSTTAVIDLVNDQTPFQQLQPNPFTTIKDESYITVTQHNHGLSIGSYVLLDFDTVDSAGSPVILNGIAASHIANNLFSIVSDETLMPTIVDQHNYKISLKTTYITMGNFVVGGRYKITTTGTDFTNIGATSNTVGTIFTATGTGTSGSAGVAIPVALSSSVVGGSNVYATQNINFNEMHPQIDEFLMPDTYITYNAQISSGRSLDGGEIPYLLPGSYSEIIPNASNFFTEPKMVASDINEQKFMQSAHSLTIRAEMRSTNNACTPMLNLSRCSALVVENIIAGADRAESNPDAPTSKYFTKKVKLAAAATGLYVEFSANIPPSADVLVYYKVGNSSDSALFEVVPWVQMEPTSTITKTDDRYAYIPTTYKLETVPNYEGGFDTVQVKIVLASTNSSTIPKVKELKVVALV